MSDLVRLGVVGAGGIVIGRHLPNLRQIPGVELIAVCNRSRPTSEKAAAEWGFRHVETDWQTLVRRGDINAVLIGTWPYLHHPVTLAALAAGKHVFCQARMAMNVREARAMLAAAEASDRVTMLCPPPIGLRGDWHMEDLLQSGFIGEPYAFSVRALTAQCADPHVPFSWRMDPALSGVNTLTVGMYAEVIHRWLGPTAQVAALTRVCVPQRTDPVSGMNRKVGIPDLVLADVRMANGVLGQYAFSNVTRFAGPSRIEIWGREGTLVYDVDTDQISGARTGDEALRPLPTPAERVRPWTVEGDFVRAIREGTPASPSFADGVHYMEVTEAIHRSMATGERITLPLAEL